MKRLSFLYCILVIGFILGVRNGYIALWQEGKADPVKIFPYRASMLPEDDQKALKNGIRIPESSELERLLQDYMS